MRNFFFATLLVLLSGNLSAFEPKETTRISLLTADPGEELYALFGHSALRVLDTVQKFEKIYNWGTFDFNTPNFYIKFARGKLEYMLTAENWRQYIWIYLEEDRTVIEQVFNLTTDEKKQLFAIAENNLKPENRFYKYDFFLDNCATRIRDHIDSVVGYKITIDESKVPGGKTIREILIPFLVYSKWNKLGLDLVLGMMVDRPLTAYNYMFMPDWTMKCYAFTRLPDSSKFVSEHIVLNQASSNKVIKKTKISPSLVFYGLLFLTILGVFKKKLAGVFDFILLFSTGILGLLLLLLWFATDHSAPANNLNVLWAWAPNLFMAFFIGGKKPKRFLAGYFKVYTLTLVTLVVFWKLIPQDLNNSLIPLLIVLIIRSIRLVRKYQVV